MNEWMYMDYGWKGQTPECGYVHCHRIDGDFNLFNIPFHSFEEIMKVTIIIKKRKCLIKCTLMFKEKRYERIKKQRNKIVCACRWIYHKYEQIYVRKEINIKGNWLKCLASSSAKPMGHLFLILLYFLFLMSMYSFTMKTNQPLKKRLNALPYIHTYKRKSKSISLAISYFWVVLIKLLRLCVI